MDEFRHIVNMEEANLFTTEVFCHFLKFSKQQRGLPSSFHEEQSNEVRVVVNKEDVIREVPIAMGK
jgi:hypothetical protein